MRCPRIHRLFFVLMVAAIAPQGGAAEPPVKAAVFNFELIDTSLQGAMGGARPEEEERLLLISDMLRRELAASGRYVVMDLAPAREQIRAAGHLHGCNRCAARIGRTVGADVAITGTIQKVSNLILNINLHLWDTATGEPLQGMSADLRGNNDESWIRGLSYLLRHRLLKEPAPE